MKSGKSSEPNLHFWVQNVDFPGCIITPRKLTCLLNRNSFGREYIFRPLIFRKHVSFQGVYARLASTFHSRWAFLMPSASAAASLATASSAATTWRGNKNGGWDRRDSSYPRKTNMIIMHPWWGGIGGTLPKTYMNHGKTNYEWRCISYWK